MPTLPIALPGLSAEFTAGPVDDDLCNHRLRSIRHPATGRLLSCDEAPGVNGRFGFGLFRAYGAASHLGELRVVPYRTETVPDGLRLHWPIYPGHPVRVSLRVVAAPPDAVDLEIGCAAVGEVRGYHLLIAGYLAPGARSRVAVGTPMRPVQIAPADHPEFHGMWPFFPRDEAAAHLLTDGRGARGRWPWRVVCLRDHALPLAAGGFPDAEVRLIGTAGDVLAVGATYAGDEAHDGIANHRALYLALFGRDVHPGEAWSTRVRIQVASPGDVADWSGSVAALAQAHAQTPQPTPGIEEYRP